MSEFGRLKALLRRSARDGTARPGRVEYGTGSTGVGRLLDQVDIAVLRQRLCFEFDDGSCLLCVASGRRLVRLLPPAPPGLTAEQLALFDRGCLAPEDVQALCKLLGGLCERGSSFAMTAEPLANEIDPTHGGVEPAAIAEVARLPSAGPFEPEDYPSHEAFLDALGTSVESVLLVEGEDALLVRGEGDAAAFIVDWAESALEALLSPGFPLLGTLETSGILLFALPETAGFHLLIAGRRGSLLAATVKGGDVAATLDRWRALFL